MEFKDFIVHNPTPGVWLLDEMSAVTLSLIVGEKKALLLDTGFDKGELPQVVASITDLPVMLVHTHCHVDHTMGNPWWTEAWIHPADLDEAEKQPWNANMTFHSLEDGDVIDLGGRALTVLHVPGHSPGCISLLDEKNRILFVGDTVNSGTVSINKYPGSVDDFVGSLDRLYDLRDKFDVIYTAHRDWPLTPEDLGVLRECAHEAQRHEQPETEFFSSLITPDRVEVNLLRSGYQKGRFSVTMKMLSVPK